MRTVHNKNAAEAYVNKSICKLFSHYGSLPLVPKLSPYFCTTARKKSTQKDPTILNSLNQCDFTLTDKDKIYIITKKFIYS